MHWIKNKTGCIIARCMISLLWNENSQKFALFQEQIYPAGCAPTFSQMLDKACIERAKQLQVQLLCNKKEEPENPITLQAFKGIMPFEYVDGLDDPIQTDAGYEISNCSYVF